MSRKRIKGAIPQLPVPNGGGTRPIERKPIQLGPGRKATKHEAAQPTSPRHRRFKSKGSS
jgi:hypothetical protein